MDGEEDNDRQIGIREGQNDHMVRFFFQNNFIFCANLTSP